MHAYVHICTYVCLCGVCVCVRVYEHMPTHKCMPVSISVCGAGTPDAVCTHEEGKSINKQISIRKVMHQHVSMLLSEYGTHIHKCIHM